MIENGQVVQQRATDVPPDAPWWFVYIVAVWPRIWREISTWLAGAAGLLQLASESSDLWLPQLTPYLSGPVLHWTTLALVVGAILAKFFPQKAPPTPPAPAVQPEKKEPT